ncbi:hypothetical protein M3Y97_00876400 [Aphelenchoides bicaudatus]|nr:hypothetical protein M3Y97_00876400 [Aphelenchoides bicaudatus]
MKTRMLGSALVLSLVYLFVQCAAAESNHEAAERPDSMQNYLRPFYDNQLYVPRLQANEILAKRANLLPYSGGIYGKRSPIAPFSGGIYGKRAALVPMSGGVYGKRSQDSALGDLLSDQVNVEIRAMPMNGGFFG